MRLIIAVLILLAACAPTELEPIVEHPISDEPRAAPITQPKRLVCDYDEWSRRLICR